jgi:hypothetical protein
VAIKRTVEWLLTCEPAEADARVRAALESLEMNPDGPPGSITGSAKRAITRNRWAADVLVTIEPVAPDTAVYCQIDMFGNKHFAVASELAEAIGDDVFADRGITSAIERLGRLSRMFGRREVRHLHNLLRSSETVFAVGEGKHDNDIGLIVMTNERLFFFEKSFNHREKVEEFAIPAITSMAVSKKRTGETLRVQVGLAAAEITNMMHGQGDDIRRAYQHVLDIGRTSAAPPTSPTVLPAAAEDPIGQLERLAALRDQGIVTADEFEHKKAELLGRL